jgi:hypothetical protein
MRTSILATIVIAGSAFAFPSMAQQQAAPSPQTADQVHQNVDKDVKTGDQASEQMQREADKGIKTRNSGESGFVGDQDKPGASAHAPGQPKGDETMGKASDKPR